MLFDIKHLPSPIAILIFLTLGCGKEKKSDDCIDEDAIAPEAPCIKIYAPVCGCNDITYGNSCEATNAGVLRWTSGPCKN